MASTLNKLVFEILLIYPYVAVIYEGRSFNSGTNAPPYHMAVRKLWKLQYFQWGVILNNGTNSYLNPFSLL